MFVRRKRNRSGTTSVVVVEKRNGSFKECITMGVSDDANQIEEYVRQGKEWIRHRSGMADIFTDTEDKDMEKKEIERFMDSIENILVNGESLILDRIFDRIGFDKIDDDVFRKLVIARLSCPSSKAATVEYLKNHFDEDVDLSKIYRYLDKLNHTQQEKVQDISVRHTRELLGGNIGVMFYDVTTLYFEADREDDLRKTGFSKEGRHKNPQIILGLLVSEDGYPLSYSIFSGKQYEGYTMIPVIDDFVQRFSLTDFVVVADAGLMNEKNVELLESAGYRYVIGARIRKESPKVKEWMLSMAKVDGNMDEYRKGGKRRLVVSYSEARARKSAHNREKGVEKLRKAYAKGTLTKDKVNKHGHNKFLDISKDIEVSINEDKILEDAAWDGLKGYLTDTELGMEEVVRQYHGLWVVERAFRVGKGQLEMRPMFHFTEKRIEAHICICFVAYKMYKELERNIRQLGIPMSVDKVLSVAKTITTIRLRLPNGELYTETLYTTPQQEAIRPLIDPDFV